MEGMHRRTAVPPVLALFGLLAALVAALAPPSPGGPVAAAHPTGAESAAHWVDSVALRTSDFVPNPDVWLVGVESFSSSASPGSSPQVTLGSGFVVSAGAGGAWIATANHVVRSHGAAVYMVGGRMPHLADRLVRSTAADLALLHVPSLRGVTPAQLSSVPPSTWAAEVACVRWPGWTYQSYPVQVGPQSFTTAPGVGPVLLTPSLSVLPGCSGGPIIAYSSQLGAAPTVAGVAVDGVTNPTAVGYVPASTVQSLMREAGAGG